MTRIEQFDKNIKQPLLQIKNEAEILSIDDLDDNQKLEIARAKKALKYIEDYIDLLDPDLLPQTFYNQIQLKIQSWNKTIQTLNSILDDILCCLASCSSVYIPKNQASTSIREIIKPYNDTIKESLEAINFSKIKKVAKSIENYENRLLSVEDSIQNQVEDSRTKIQTWFNEIEKFNKSFFKKQNNKDISIKAEIESIQNYINDKRKQIDDMTINFI